MFANIFRQRYLSSLQDHFRSFYDDFCQYGDIETATHCLYFIPGIDGAPGQIRYGFPALVKLFGHTIYLRSLYLPEFSAQSSIWEKYSIANVEKKTNQIVHDLVELSQKFSKIMVVCSSNGFYDFLHATKRLPDIVQSKLVLFWLSCSPDHFSPSPWESIFFKLNGFVHENHQWVAFPNNNWMKWINPETASRYKWTYNKPAKYFYKQDIESRFHLWGSLWSYFSRSCFNECLMHLKKDFTQPLNIPTYLLAAEKDGYWQGKSTNDMVALTNKFVNDPNILFKPSSHLWVLTPNHIYELLQMAKKDLNISE